jgi:hypothetical protein
MPHRGLLRAKISGHGSLGEGRQQILETGKLARDERNPSNKFERINYIETFLAIFSTSKSE